MIGLGAGSISRRISTLLILIAAVYVVGNVIMHQVHAEHEIGGEAYERLSAGRGTLSDLAVLKSDLNELRLKTALIAGARNLQVGHLRKRSLALEMRVERRFQELRKRDLTFDARIPLEAAYATWRDFAASARQDAQVRSAEQAQADASRQAWAALERRQRRFVEQIDVVMNTVRLRVTALEMNTIDQVEKKEHVVLLMSAALMALVMLGAFLLARRLRRIVRRMVTTCERIAGGDLEVRVPVSEDQEFGALARAFNAMTENLRGTTVKRSYVADVLDSMTTAVLVTDKAGTIRTANVAASALLARRESDLVGQQVESLFADPIEAARWRRESGPRAAREVRWRTADGSERPVLLSVAGLVGDESDGGGRIYAAEDIAQLVQTREQLADSQVQLNHAQKMDAIGHLAGGVAHDFNNILTSIIGTSEMMLADLPSGSSDREDIEEILQAGRRAARLTRQLLLFARKDAPELRPLEFNEAVSELEKMLRRVIGEDITLETRLGEAVGTVLGDRSQIQQVMMNLAVNARDAMPGGGTLTISTSVLDVAKDNPVAGTRLQSGKYVMLAVGDTGCGMSAEVQGRIFEPLYTTKAQGRGTGLGLSTVYGIAEQSGGAVTVDSKVGEGSTFRLYLPVSARTGVRSGVYETPPPEGAIAGLTILLAEDDAMVRRMTRRMLRGHDAVVLEAVSGEEAVRLGREHAGNIDVLLTDVIMPGLHGPDVAEQLLALRPDMAVVFMSGYTGESSGAVERLRNNAILLPKPFTAQQLLTHLMKALDASEMARAAGSRS